MSKLAQMSSFLPHGVFYLWSTVPCPERTAKGLSACVALTSSSWLIGLHIISSGIIMLSYFSIPTILIYILNKRYDIPSKIFLLFATFVLCCGTADTFDLWTLWFPNHWISNFIRLLMALASLAIAITLAFEIAQILAIPAPKQVTEINQQLQAKIAELQRQKIIIRQQEKFLRNIYNNVREAIFVVDIESDDTFRYQGFNPAAQELTGIKEVINKTPLQILPPEVATEVEHRYRKCLESKTTISYEECLPFQGEDTWWLTSLNPIKDQTGNLSRIIGISLNITQRKQAEAELEQERVFIKAVLNNLSDGIVACNQNGILALFNQASQKFFTVPQEPLPPELWAAHYSLYDAEGKEYLKQEDIPLFRAFSGETFNNVELMVIPESGKPRTLIANGSPIVDTKGVKLGAVVAVQDITERKQAEQALARLNEELEDRVKQRTTQLEHLNAILLTTTARLEQRNQELDQFAYIISHDLKAPLRAIANLAEWIEEDLTDKLDDDTRHNMNLLRGRVKRLEKMINGLLNYSRVGRLEYEPELVDVNQMIADIIDSLDVNSHFQIEIQPDLPIFVTELIPLQQVFNNLISNAIKHSDCTQGRIIVSVEEQEYDYEFLVSDNGKGIEPQYHERIFTIFQTIEAKDTKESTGIGLAIVKKAVESQGGKIVIESQVGQGTTFRFTWSKARRV